MTLTISGFAKEIGLDRHALEKKVRASGAKAASTVKGGKADGSKLYSLRDLYNASLGGDQAAENLRKTKEDADRLALANARTRGELVEIAAVKKLGEKVMVAIRNRILAMPLTDEEKDRCLGELMALGSMD